MSANLETRYPSLCYPAGMGSQKVTQREMHQLSLGWVIAADP